METQVTIYKGYVISTEEGVEKGIFFRSPIQKVDFDAYYGTTKFSASKFANKIKNPIRKLYEILIGNGNSVKFINDWLNDIDFGGFKGNILTFPVYFKRKYRKLIAQTSNDEVIEKIESYGYESEYNICSGACFVERTKIHFKSGKVTHIKRTGYYKYTYTHIAKDIIDNNDTLN